MLIAWDLETLPIAHKLLCPPIVCGSFCSDLETDVIANVGGSLYGSIKDILRKHVSVIHNAHFDLGCVAAEWPDLIPDIFQALWEGRVHCTLIREKMLNLARHGKLEFIEAPDGKSVSRIGYSLNAIMQDRFNIDRSAEKQGDDIWRKNYGMLQGLPIEEYPDEAVQYAEQDAVDCNRVYLDQEKDKEAAEKLLGVDVFASETFRVGCDFVLRLVSAWGWEIDQEARDSIKQQLQDLTSGDHVALLEERGIIRPGSRSRVFKTQLRTAARILNTEARTIAGRPLTLEHEALLTKHNIRFTKAKKPSRNMRKLRSLVESVCNQHSIEIKRTGSQLVSTDDEFLSSIEHLDPVLSQYHAFAKLLKLVNTEIPRIESDLVHPMFDVLKETGRTSSSKDKLYPSCNIQNVDPRVRPCYKPREGHLLCSCDYSALELGTLAQKLYSLFGDNVLRRLLMDGIDPHAYLGAQLALHLDEHFGQSCKDEGLKEPMEVYSAFLACKTAASDKVRAFFKHYRTFAKPTGLGYPGGLGPETFCTFAKATYGISVDLETAAHLKDIWMDTFPEMVKYFEWINVNCEDPYNPGSYAYISPLGLYRAGASYCAACNGAALQTPAAEGALLATFNVGRACYDPTEGSILLGSHILAFIHDELIVEIPDEGPDRNTERAVEIAGLMEEAMFAVNPNVPIKAEPVLMRRWYKQAEPVFDTEGSLEVWEPTESSAQAS